MKIPVFDVGIGEVHKRDVKKACIMKEKKHPEYALILAFDVKVNQEAQKQADTDGVTIFHRGHHLPLAGQVHKVHGEVPRITED